jgi:type VI protein secretion system component VasK
MFTLPSMWNIVISTIVFIIAAWYIRRLLDAQGIPKGMTRGLLVFVLAYMVAWTSGKAVDWLHDKIVGKEVAAQEEAKSAEELKQMLEQIQQLQ